MEDTTFKKNNIDLETDVRNFQDFISLLLKETIDKKLQKRGKDEQSFMIIKIGPPCSGKSLIDGIGYNIIKDKFLPHKNINDIEKTFINVNIDNYVYNVKISPPIYPSVLNIEPLKCELTGYNSLKLTCDLTSNMEERIDKCSKIYTETRDSINSLPMIMIYISLYLNLNIIFETLGSTWVLDYLINSFCNDYNIIPIVLYPIIDESLILERIVSRANTEYRWLDPSSVKEAIVKTEYFYNLLLRKINTINIIIIYKFDNNIVKSDKNINKFYWKKTIIDEVKDIYLQDDRPQIGHTFSY